MNNAPLNKTQVIMHSLVLSLTHLPLKYNNPSRLATLLMLLHALLAGWWIWLGVAVLGFTWFVFNVACWLFHAYLNRESAVTAMLPVCNVATGM